MHSWTIVLIQLAIVAIAYLLCHVSIYNYFCLDTSSHPHKLSIILAQVSIDSPEILVNSVFFSTILKNVISKHFCMLLSKCVKLILMKTHQLSKLATCKVYNVHLSDAFTLKPFHATSPFLSNYFKGCRKSPGHCGLIRLC